MSLILQAVGLLALVPILIVYSVLAGSFVLSILWGWFITPLSGVPVPPLPLLAGLRAVVYYLTSHSTPHYRDHPQQIFAPLMTGLLLPWFALFGGWLIHLWAGMSLGVWGS